jgi:hypothetical protein
VIADLSVNFVERQALLCGYTIDPIVRDYGYDLVLVSYDSTGEVENGYVHLQMKATDHLRVLRGGQFVSFRVKRSDLALWLKEVMPVILVVYDAEADSAYWLYVQRYFEQRTDYTPSPAQESTTVHLPKANVVDQAAIRKFVEFKASILRQANRVIRHDV